MAPRFFCDDHLRRLARWLRAAGFDTAWEAAIDNVTMLARCRAEGRVLLSLDRSLRGPEVCLLPSHDPLVQLRHVRERFGLDLLAAAFTRCPVCNETLAAVAPERADAPARVRAACDRFRRCASCGRTYWEGDHVRHMRERFALLTPGSPGC